MPTTSHRHIRLWLVRHVLSAANLDKEVNGRLPDQMVPQAPVGPQQGRAAGQFLAQQLHSFANKGRVRVLSSPYLRARQTAQHIRAALQEHDVPHDYREEIALREISFGLFDGYSDEELPVQFPREHAHYQKHMQAAADGTSSNEFWAQMPQGESRAQVADRVKGVFGTILRDNSRDREHPVTNFVIVSHGVTLRAFVMQWMHHPFEWYGQQTNPANASVQLISSTPPEEPGRYAHELMFPGFEHKRQSTQDKREEGRV